MRIMFRQHWRHSEQLARHAWRCYINRPDVTVDVMSKPSLDAWIACNTVWDRLTPRERFMMRLYHKTGGTPEESKAAIVQWAADNGMQEWQFMITIKDCYRQWAVERGLADPDTAGQNRPDGNTTDNSEAD